jgi:FkbM family methyltransferase
MITDNSYNVIKDTPQGYVLYNKNDKYVGKSIEIYGYYQLEETKFFDGFVKEGDTVIDIGANIGTHTLWFANKVGEDGLVLAFEPQRLIFQTLCANMAINSIQNVDCKHMGVGSAQKLVDVPPLDPTVPNNFGALSIKNQTVGDKVAICKIDDIGLPRCDFIKIDVEGMEPEVLMGGLNTIMKLRPYLYMEIDREENTPLIMTILDELGYTIERHNPPFYSADYKEENIFGGTGSINAICIPKEKHGGSN